MWADSGLTASVLWLADPRLALPYCRRRRSCCLAATAELLELAIEEQHIIKAGSWFTIPGHLAGLDAAPSTVREEEEEGEEAAAAAGEGELPEGSGDLKMQGISKLRDEVQAPRRHGYSHACQAKHQRDRLICSDLILRVVVLQLERRPLMQKALARLVAPAEDAPVVEEDADAPYGPE